MKHMETHPEPVDGCYGCKIMNVNFGTMAGGTRSMSRRKDFEVQTKKDLDAYANARRAGEQPDASTVKGVRRARMRQERNERLASKGYEVVEGSN
jgi:hypothetical protein